MSKCSGRLNTFSFNPKTMNLPYLIGRKMQIGQGLYDFEIRIKDNFPLFYFFIVFYFNYQSHIAKRSELFIGVIKLNTNSPL